jgi:hypothetical protein
MGWVLKDYVTLYAASVATLTAFWQVRNAMRDRAVLRVLIRLAKGNLVATATNIGRRPITVQHLRIRYRVRGAESRDITAMPQERVESHSGLPAKYIDRPIQLGETQALDVSVELPREFFSADLLAVQVEDSTAHSWKPSGRILRQLRGEIRGLSKKDIDKLFPTITDPPPRYVGPRVGDGPWKNRPKFDLGNQ